MSPSQDTRTRILDSALELFYERGYDGTTTRAIAQRAEVNEVTLFRQFGSKRNVFLAVIDRETDITGDVAEFELEVTGDMEADLARAGERIIEEMVARAKLVRIIMTEASRDPGVWEHVSQAPFGVLERITQYFREAGDRGLMGDVDPGLAAVAYFSFFFRSLVSNAFLGGDVFIDMDRETIREFSGIIARGVATGG